MSTGKMVSNLRSGSAWMACIMASSLARLSLVSPGSPSSVVSGPRTPSEISGKATRELRRPFEKPSSQSSPLTSRLASRYTMTRCPAGVVVLLSSSYSRLAWYFSDLTRYEMKAEYIASPRDTRQPWRADAISSTELKRFSIRFSRPLVMTSASADEMRDRCSSGATSRTLGALASRSPATLADASMGEEQSKGSWPVTRWKSEAERDQMSVAKLTLSGLMKHSGEE
mmetsp:Transcript_36403/g.95743  ORF Transcript_36403/g.95743 Transcript_36403/m.95743 type:complete len:227 (-) Transcript_36403:2087-2767(-)